MVALRRLYTPIFAMARIVGWSAHRIEELINIDKIIRPAYMSIGEKRAYEKIKDRGVGRIADHAEHQKFLTEKK